MNQIASVSHELESADVETLTIWCKEAYEHCSLTYERAITQTLRLGQILSVVRRKIPHGQWIPWVSETFGDGISLRKIQECIQCAEKYAQDPAHFECAKNLTEAVSALSVPRTDQPKASSVETYHAPIEVTAREPEPEKKPSVKVREPKKPKSVGEFVLVNRLDEDREKILDIAGDYLEHKKLAEFVSLLKGLLQELLAGDLQP